MQAVRGVGSESTRHGKRGAAVTMAKACVSILLVAAIVWKVPIGGAIAAIAVLSPAAIAAVVLLTFAFPALAALRWQRALLRTGTREPWTKLVADVLVSSTYNMLLPTNIGGDVVRAIRCARRLDHPHRAWSSMIFERLIGIVALVLLAVPGVLLVPTPPKEIAGAVVLVAIAAIGFVLFADAPFRWVARRLVARAPRAAGIGQNIAADLAGPLATTAARLEMIAWSVLYQIVGLGILVVVVVDWHMPAMTLAVFGAVPLALVLTLLPVSIAGLGVRESLFVVLLGRFGLSSDRALSLAVVWLASALLLALAGCVVMLAEPATSKVFPERTRSDSGRSDRDSAGPGAHAERNGMKDGRAG